MLATILLVSAFFTLIATSVQLYSDHMRDLDQLDQRIQAIERSHLPALSLAVWSLDSTLIETQLKSLLSLPDVDSVELDTKYGETFTVNKLTEDGDFRSYSFQIFNDAARTFDLGNLTIKCDNRRIYQRMWDRVLVIFITNGVRTLFVSISILIIVHLLLTRHLSRIASFIRSMRLSKLHEPFVLERRPHAYYDELDTIVLAVNDMTQTLQQDVQLLEDMRKSLLQSEEKYRLAMEATQDGLWDWDIVSGQVYYSPSWASMLGIPQVKNRYETWAERIHPDDVQRVSASLQHHLQGKSEIWEAEHRLRKKEGDWIWVLGRGRVVERSQDRQPQRMIGTISNIQSKKNSEQIIWHQANHDELTGLPNRKLFLELLNQEIKQAERNSNLIWLLFLDLDGFKEVNDTLGHDMGDRLLQAVGARMQTALRRADIIARLGGDEFVVIVSQSTDAKGVDHVASKLIESIGSEYVIENEVIRISTSIGIANYPSDASNAFDLLKFADQSMYAAKQDGKGRFVYFTPAMQSASLLRKQFSEDIRRGIQHNHFRLYYQPILDLENRSLKKAEALLRWEHPEHGLVHPDAFIPIAEETGLIIELGAWIFEQAFKQLQLWQRLDSNFQLSINMSPLQIRTQDDLCHVMLTQLDKFSLQGKSIVVEITENLLLNCDKSVKDKLLHYRDAGVQVAIDDFGTGYSSLSYLKEFNIDYLKIDRSFTRNLKPGSSETAISKAIIAMAHELDIEVIAEGLETEQQSDILLEIGCKYGQGYLFSKPLPAADFERRFLNRTSSSQA